MSQIIESNVASNDNKYLINLTEISSDISSINDDDCIENEKYPIYISETSNIASSINAADSIKNENNYVTTQEHICIKEEPLIAVDESDTMVEMKNFPFPTQGLLHVKVCLIVCTLVTYC